MFHKKNSHVISGFFILTFLMFQALLTAERTQPNIVFIFADDLGWKDVGYQGTDFYETPNIDRLAREGMVFTDAYAAAGNCAPSRACLLSGQYTPRHGVYAVTSTERGPKNLMRLLPIPNTVYLAPEMVTMAEALKEAGYATGCFGKWHLNSAKVPGTEPGDQGFETVLDQNYPGSGVKEDPKGIYTLCRAACDFMEQNRTKPFFAYIAHHAIHSGLQTRQATLDKFKNKQPGEQHNNALYAGCTYDLDDGVGIVLKKLRDLKLEENTLVVFTSDNGGTPQSSQEPLRGAKGCYYEGGIREPFIVRWPGIVAAGSTCSVPVINLDLFPTFLDATNTKAPVGKILDGESLMPLLHGDGVLQRQAIFWHFPGYLNNPVPRGRDPIFRTRPVSVIRKGDWKLLLYHEEWQLDGGRDHLDTNNAVELYNLKEDIGERNDLAQLNKAKRDELLVDLLHWQSQIQASLPSQPNPAYESNSSSSDLPPKKQVRQNKKL